jgi:hypothetical protein
MKRYLILLLIPFLMGAAPSRLHTYTTGTTIESSKVTANEDAIFNYLTAGVDTYADDSLVNADVNSSAGISDEKLDLATIAQAITFNGTSTFSGASTFSANVTFAGQTIADLGTVTTGVFTGVDITSGTVDGIERFGMTTVTEILDILDEDDMASDSPNALITQQSAKKYVDDNAVAGIIKYTANAVYTAPTGVTQILVSITGGGGGGGGPEASGADGGGGGGGGETVLNYSYTVVPGNSYSFVSGAGGAAGGVGANGSAGSASTWDGTLTVDGGSGGDQNKTGGAGGGSATDLNGGTPTGGSMGFLGGTGGTGGTGGSVSGGGGGGTRISVGGAGGTGGVGTAGECGSGGGGGAYDGGGFAGGAGGDGCLIITY